MSTGTELVDPDRPSGGEAVLTLDRTGHVTMCGGAVRELTGEAPESLCGRHAGDLLTRPEAWRQLERQTGTGPGAGSGSAELRRPDGPPLPVRLLVWALSEPEGAGFLVQMVPEAVARRRDENEALVRALFQQTQVGLAIQDLDLTTTRLNLPSEAAGARAGTGIPVHPVGRTIEEVLLPEDARAVRERLERVAETGEPLIDWVHRARQRDRPDRDRVVSFSAFRLDDARARPMGMVVVHTDVTDQHVAQERMNLLHVAAERIGRSLDVTRMAQDLADTLVSLGFADLVAVDLAEGVLLGEEPGDFRNGAPVARVAVAAADGAPWPGELYGSGDRYRLTREGGSRLRSGHADVIPDLDQVRADIGGVPEIDRVLLPASASSALIAPLNARGSVLGVLALWRSRSRHPLTPGDTDLAEELASRAALGLDNARRYTREQRTAEALQRSLLPRAASETSAAEAAGHYVPAGTTAGIGGTWFDVISLSSARLAFVVGEVAGHGLGAATTMGRLRTAVQTLADLDLSPGELLTHLDDLAVHLGEAEGGPDGGETGLGVFGDTVVPAGRLAVGASCLYCVYDPVDGRCEMASAGHPPPVYAVPGEEPSEVDVKPGPVLGIGGEPFEQAVLYVPPDTVLAFHNPPLLADTAGSGAPGGSGPPAGASADTSAGTAAGSAPGPSRNAADAARTAEGTDAGTGAPDAGTGAPDAGTGAPDAGTDAPDAEAAAGPSAEAAEASRADAASEAAEASRPDAASEAAADARGGSGDRRSRLMALLRTAADQRQTASDAGRAVLGELLVGSPDDDVSLLVARTRRLSQDAVATWHFPAEPAVVGQAREVVESRLATWNLDQLMFSTELIISELVTNAVRYGGDGPIGLRLIKDKYLICEVSDVSQTQPRLRRARLSDEGGRGLFLVAQLAHRWGSRYTENGKTIWAAQSLDPAE
ncbi:SpoIIE family protein phosphatase [Streptomyces sp. Ru87]|uniref:SpoIIE family protein phosphatase n=1 Tax=Streptomyces sp. Ru87 TaxID=2044307 RepID=UPI0015D48420|nr:SpoIIE family protein phosphatase [Streptomyces sp. Ru87]